MIFFFVFRDVPECSMFLVLSTAHSLVVINEAANQRLIHNEVICKVFVGSIESNVKRLNNPKTYSLKVLCTY